MGLDVLSVNLDNSARQYSPGQAASGKVLLSVSEEETTTAVLIRFFGFAHTHWTEEETSSSSDDHSTETVYYEATQSLFDMNLRLFGDGNNRIRIPTGNNVFPFSFQVPTRPLPVTCSFENGSVQYGLEARVRKPWYQFDPKTDILPVTIFTVVDLNITPGTGLSMYVEDTRVFGFCTRCCPSPPCFLRSITPKSGFIPGEVVPCVIEVHNTSNYTVEALTATLTQLWTLSAYGRHGWHLRTHPLALQGVGHPGMRPGQGVTWEVGFTLPPSITPSPNPSACDIVQMEYVIMISADMEGCCRRNDFAVTHPIIVGTIPLVHPAIVSGQTPKYDEKGGLA